MDALDQEFKAFASQQDFIDYKWFLIEIFSERSMIFMQASEFQ